MWTSGLRNHPPERHSSLPSQAGVVVTGILRLRRPHAEEPAAAALDVDRKLPQAPLLDRAPRANCARATRQRLAFDAALIGPHAPRAGFVLRNEVDVRALRCQPRIESKRPAAFLHPHVVDLVA